MNFEETLKQKGVTPLNVQIEIARQLKRIADVLEQPTSTPQEKKS